MKHKNENAFPIVSDDNSRNQTIYVGLTKLEYFAAMALSGMSLDHYGKFQTNEIKEGNITQVEWASRAAVLYAKALLAELEKEREG